MAPATFARIKDLWRFSSRCVPPLYPAGVYRYRTIEASQLARDRAVIERMKTLRARRDR